MILTKQKTGHVGRFFIQVSQQNMRRELTQRLELLSCLDRQNLAATIHAGLQIDMVRAAQLA